MTEQELREAVQHTIIGALLGTLSIGGATDAIMVAVQQFCAGKGGTSPADDCEWDRQVTRYYEGGESDEG